MRFGNWEFDEKHLTLTNTGEGRGYYVDLERCATSAQVLDWICQIDSKPWATKEDVGSLVRAITFLLNPQATLCGEGKDHGPLDVRSVIEHNRELRNLLK